MGIREKKIKKIKETSGDVCTSDTTGGRGGFFRAGIGEDNGRGSLSVRGGEGERSGSGEATVSESFRESGSGLSESFRGGKGGLGEELSLRGSEEKLFIRESLRGVSGKAFESFRGDPGGLEGKGGGMVGDEVRLSDAPRGEPLSVIEPDLVARSRSPSAEPLLPRAGPIRSSYGSSSYSE